MGEGNLVVSLVCGSSGQLNQWSLKVFHSENSNRVSQSLLITVPSAFFFKSLILLRNDVSAWN